MDIDRPLPSDSRASCAVDLCVRQALRRLGTCQLSHQRNRKRRGCASKRFQVLPIRAIAPIPCTLYTIDSSDLPSAPSTCKPREHAHRLGAIVSFPCTLMCIHVLSSHMNQKKCFPIACCYSIDGHHTGGRYNKHDNISLDGLQYTDYINGRSRRRTGEPRKQNAQIMCRAIEHRRQRRRCRWRQRLARIPARARPGQDSLLWWAYGSDCIKRAIDSKTL